MSRSAMTSVTTPLPESSATPSYSSIQYDKVPVDQEEEYNSSTDTPSYRAVIYKVYPWRWFMLFALCFLNVSNGMVSLY